MARAAQDFVGCKEEGDGLLPVTGNIPDMFIDSERLEINNFSNIVEMASKAALNRSVIP